MTMIKKHINSKRLYFPPKSRQIDLMAEGVLAAATAEASSPDVGPGGEEEGGGNKERLSKRFIFIDDDFEE